LAEGVVRRAIAALAIWSGSVRPARLRVVAGGGVGRSSWRWWSGSARRPCLTIAALRGHVIGG
jgi:hypothetical protein